MPLGGRKVSGKATGVDLRYLEAPELLRDFQGDKTQLQSDIREAWLNTPGVELQVNRDDSGNLLSRTVEFTWIDWTKREHQVWREEFNLIASSKMSCFSGRSLKTKVERVVSKREKEMRTRYPPPKNLLILRTAQLVLVPHLHQNRYPGMTRLARFEASEDGKAWLKRQEFLKPFLNEALDTLWWNPEEDQKAATADLSKRTAEERAAMETIADWVDTSQQSVYDIAEKDLIAGTNEDVLPRTSRDVIYLGVDKNQKVVLFRWRGAMEVLLGKAILTKFPQDRDTFAKYQPCPAGDFARHPLNAEWLRRNEQFDMMKTPGACQGVWHFGVGEEIGKGPKSVRLKTDSVLGIEKMKSEDGSNGRKADPDLVRIRDQMMMEGVFPPVTRAIMFVHGILDPVQLKKQQAAMQQLKQIGGVMTVPDEAYSIRGVLKDVKTESHRDTGDVVPGLALLCVFGDAKGGDFCAPELGARLSFEAGDILAVQGREARHFTNWWNGTRRYSVVHSFREMAMRRAE